MKTAESAAHAKHGTGPPLTIEVAEVDENCAISRWTAADLDHLARIIAIVAMGQSAHAARIISELLPAKPAFDHEALRKDAQRRLSVIGKTAQQQDASRHQRDGLIFEAISWAAAQQATNGKALLRDPHISSTTQGLDGLMIEFDETGSQIARTTIFEDKCSEHPRRKFRDEILPAFKAYHANKRAAELMEAAAALLQRSGLDGTEATMAAAKVLDMNYRGYRGSLAVTTEHDSPGRRKGLFKNYDELSDIEAAQRIGAVFVTSDSLRSWFDELASRAVAFLDTLGPGSADV